MAVPRIADAAAIRDAARLDERQRVVPPEARAREGVPICGVWLMHDRLPLAAARGFRLAEKSFFYEPWKRCRLRRLSGRGIIRYGLSLGRFERHAVAEELAVKTAPTKCTEQRGSGLDREGFQAEGSFGAGCHCET